MRRSSRVIGSVLAFALVACAPPARPKDEAIIDVAFSKGGTSGFIWSDKQFANVPSPSGKTGTAQYGTPDAKGNYALHAWYTAYAPAVDPEVAVVTFVEGGGEGHEGASPAAARILSYYFAHRDQIRATTSAPPTATAVASPNDLGR